MLENDLILKDSTKHSAIELKVKLMLKFDVYMVMGHISCF
jgi:hypothetical protein